MEATFWARIRDFVRPVADEDLHDLHQHALRGVRALSLCLALLAPCGPFFLLAEQVHLHRALLLLPFHLGFYAALAALSQREFGRRHTSEAEPSSGSPTMCSSERGSARPSAPNGR